MIITNFFLLNNTLSYNNDYEKQKFKLLNYEIIQKE